MRSEGEAGRGVHRRRSGQHVAGVAEGGDVAERGHMSGEGGRVERAALGEVLQRVVHLFALFGFARHFSVPGLDTFLLHGQGSVNLNKDQFFFFFYFFGQLRKGTGFYPLSTAALTGSHWGSVFRSPFLPAPTPSCLLPGDPVACRFCSPVAIALSRSCREITSEVFQHRGC